MAYDHFQEDLIERFVVGAGGFIGEVSFYPAPEEALHLKRRGRPLWFLNDLYVHPLRRGRGWSNRLMCAALAHADDHKADVWLYAKPYGPRRTKDGRPVGRMEQEKLALFYTEWGFDLLSLKPVMEMLRRC